ncbi:MAG: hypothetical protein WD042_09700 [Phycisphaeraceae bacterium]
MSLTLSLTCGDKHWSSALPMKELEVLQHLGPDAEAPTNTLFDVSGFGESKAVPCSAVTNAARNLLGSFEDTKQTLPYSYMVQFRLPNTDLCLPATPGASGFNVKGKWFSIECGIGRCDLVRLERDERGRVKTVVMKDLRGEKSIMTDNSGEVRILKRKRPLRLTKVLQGIEQFARSCPPGASLDIRIG